VWQAMLDWSITIPYADIAENRHGVKTQNIVILSQP
jgi:hypothetical protein